MEGNECGQSLWPLIIYPCWASAYVKTRYTNVSFLEVLGEDIAKVLQLQWTYTVSDNYC